MESGDYYQLLGVSRSASSEVLKPAFRARLHAIHPDRNPGNALATDQTRELVHAYRVLSDPQARRQYDRALAVSAPVVRPPGLRRSSSSGRSSTRAWVWVVVVAAIGLAAVGLVGGVSGDGGRVYRPDLSALRFEGKLTDEATRAVDSAPPGLLNHYSSAVDPGGVQNWMCCDTTTFGLTSAEPGAMRNGPEPAVPAGP